MNLYCFVHLNKLSVFLVKTSADRGCGKQTPTSVILAKRDPTWIGRRVRYRYHDGTNGGILRLLAQALNDVQVGRCVAGYGG